jgi:hypothetical protein
MKKHIKKIIVPSIAFLLLFTISCNSNETQKSEPKALEISNNLNYRKLSQGFKDYWYAGEAEITSYELEQARYGEIRKGHAVLIYVTEEFSTRDTSKSRQSKSRKHFSFKA